MFSFACLLLLFPTSLAGGIRVEPCERPVVVLLDGQALGPAPLERQDIPPGTHTLGFRSTAFGPTLFTEGVEVPTTGTLVVSIDLTRRQVSWSSEPAAPTPEPVPEPGQSPRPEVPSAPTAVFEPEPHQPSGDLFVSSDPPGSVVLLDGVDTGLYTPTMLAAVPTGPHTVELRTACARARGDVAVREGVIERLELSMKEGTGTLSLDSDPEGADVLLDGLAVGKTPAVFPRLACGEHELVLRAPGRLEVTERVDILAYEQHVTTISLPIEQYGTLAVAPTPLEAEVSLDEVLLGTGPRTVEQVGAGEHALRVALDGYDTHQQVVDIPPEEILRVDVTLVPEQSTAWGRLVLDLGVTGAGATLAGLSLREYGLARSAYQEFLLVEDDAEADAIYQNQVLPHRRTALFEGAGATAILVGAGVLWWTTDLGIAATPDGVALTARW